MLEKVETHRQFPSAPRAEEAGIEIPDHELFQHQLSHMSTPSKAHFEREKPYRTPERYAIEVALQFK
jgi:hypothetical protein